MSRCQKTSPAKAIFLLPWEICCISGEPGWLYRSEHTKHSGHSTDYPVWEAMTVAPAKAEEQES